MGAKHLLGLRGAEGPVEKFSHLEDVSGKKMF